jgi:hypothetical protein
MYVDTACPGPLGATDPPASPFAPLSPTFGRMPNNLPFMLNVPPPATPHRDAWAPPAQAYAEIRDVDMAEASPPAARSQPPAPPTSTATTSNDVHGEQDGEEEIETKGERRVALSGLRRVYRSRQRMRERTRKTVRAADADSGLESEEEDEASVVPSMSNHYTLNVGGAPPSAPDTPYVLLGYVYAAYCEVPTVHVLCSGICSSFSTRRSSWCFCICSYSSS